MPARGRQGFCLLLGCDDITCDICVYYHPSALRLHGAPAKMLCMTDKATTMQAGSAAAMEAPERLILGIESSCDDTGAAVISSRGRVLGEALAGQADIHAPWGGVVPSLAREAHQAAIDRVVEDTLASAGVRMQDLDAVAVTVGPGLSMCLKVPHPG